MFVRQYPRYGTKEWLTQKVETVDGKLFYTNDEYINHFTNIVIDIVDKHNYKIIDINRLRNDIAKLIYTASDNK